MVFGRQGAFTEKQRLFRSRGSQKLTSGGTPRIRCALLEIRSEVGCRSSRRGRGRPSSRTWSS